MKSTTASDTIEVLEAIFACIGLTETLVSDNRRQFKNFEFKLFCKDSNIRHLCSTPYHASSNGLAERNIKTVKMMLRKILEILYSQDSTEICLLIEVH